MAITDSTSVDGITVTLGADEANAVVYAVAFEVVTEGELLSNQSISTVPGDLARIATRCERIANLQDVNDQLRWRAHWGPLGGEPEPIIADEAVLLDVAAVLHKHGRDQRPLDESEDTEYDTFAFDQAARTIARAFARVDQMEATR